MAKVQVYTFEDGDTGLEYPECPYWDNYWDDGSCRHIKRTSIYCRCGHIFTERDIGIDGEGPEDRVIFQCPDCHGITEMNREDVEL